MPFTYGTLCATYFVACSVIITIVLNAMWNSFTQYPIGLAIYAGGVEKYSSTQATVGLVSSLTSSDVLLCALVKDGGPASAFTAAVDSFSGISRLDATRLGLFNERGVTCLQFRSKPDLQDFVAALEVARAQTGGGDDEAADGMSESALSPLQDSREVAKDAEWEFV